MTLAEYLSSNSIKPSNFAASIGVPPSTILRILNRQREPGLDLLRKIMIATDGHVMPNDFVETTPGEAAQ